MEIHGAYLRSKVLTVLLLMIVVLLEVCVSEPSTIRYFKNVCGKLIDISGTDQTGMIIVDYEPRMSRYGERTWKCNVTLRTSDVDEKIAFRFYAGQSSVQCQNVIDCVCFSRTYINLGMYTHAYCFPQGTKISSVGQSDEGRVQLLFKSLSKESGSFSVLFSPFTRPYGDSCGPSTVKCHIGNMCLSESIRCSNNNYSICDDEIDVCNNQSSDKDGASYDVVTTLCVFSAVLSIVIIVICCLCKGRPRFGGVSKLINIITCKNRSPTTRSNSRSDQESDRNMLAFILVRTGQIEADELNLRRSASRDEARVHRIASLDRPPEYSSVVNTAQGPPPSYEDVVSNQEAYNVTNHI